MAWGPCASGGDAYRPALNCLPGCRFEAASVPPVTGPSDPREPAKAGATMKLFIDSGDIGEIKEAAAMGAIDGVTTNPSLLAKAGVPTKKAIAQICEVVDGPISAEVVATDTAGILTEGRELAKIHKNVVV